MTNIDPSSLVRRHIAWRKISDTRYDMSLPNGVTLALTHSLEYGWVAKFLEGDESIMEMELPVSNVNSYVSAQRHAVTRAKSELIKVIKFLDKVSD